MTMKTLSMLALVGLLAACATVKEGHDPVVVNAERTVKSAFATLDKFMVFTENHKVQLATLAPEVNKAAITIRAQAPQQFYNAWDLIDVYKKNKTAENKVKLSTALAVVDTVLADIEKALLEASQKGIKS